MILENNFMASDQSSDTQRAEPSNTKPRFVVKEMSGDSFKIEESSVKKILNGDVKASQPDDYIDEDLLKATQTRNYKSIL